MQNNTIHVKTQLQEDNEIQNRFNVHAYTFGSKLTQGDSLDFKAGKTDPYAALQLLNKTFEQENAILVFISDGQQNSGRDYAQNKAGNFTIFPVVIGDTARYQDIRLNRINVNRYSFSGNQFPVEVRYSYFGYTPASSTLKVYDNEKLIHKIPVNFASGSSSGSVTINLTSETPGLHNIRAEIMPLEGERNSENNRLETAIEVVDERIKIGLVTTTAHPDIGALKRSVEANKQREFRKLSPEEVSTGLWNADLYIFLNPDSAFKSAYEYIQQQNIPVLTLAGPQTDWAFVNGIQENYSFSDSGLLEGFQPEYNTNFDFYANDFSFNNEYAPLQGAIGELSILSESQSLFFKSYNGISSEDPLLFLIRGERREAILMGAGLWKWRIEDYRQNQNFEAFDNFMSDLWVYLTGESNSNRFVIDYQPVYETLFDAAIQARFFDESMKFDSGAEIQLQITDSLGHKFPPIPLSLRQDYFEAGLQGLTPGVFTFEIKVMNTTFKQSGQFIIKSFDLEALNSGADYQRLNLLAENTNGKLFYPDQVTELKDSLLNSEQYRPLQISLRNVVSLIDINLLLGIIILAFISEWVLRKYNGLI